MAFCVVEAIANSQKSASSLEDALPLPPVDKIGPQSFELMRVIGQGGYGKVRNALFRIPTG